MSHRMRRFADKLAVIRISLDPPSPPLIFTESECPTPAAAGDIIPTFNEFSFPIENTKFLTVPKYERDECERLTSPPPRRCSQTSTLSDNSSITISLATSYQNLLSPSYLGCSNTGNNNNINKQRDRSTSYCYSEDSVTPPSEFLFVPRPHSAQVRKKRF
jgi:hypothetical protein|uniref:Uncharacterized protein n=1 Tax=Panagrolaimus sp. PS1159 TaxID=55785 RepID=A0AC35F4Z8_9BILA